MKVRTPALTTLAGLVAMTLATAANAITIDATSPDWSNAVGGSGIAYDLANGAYTDVRWGDPANTEKSGLGFDPVNPPSLDYLPNESFLLGNLRHYNNPIFAGTAASSVDLTLLTSIAGVPALQSFAFRFLIDETPNVEPCAYPSMPGNPCADQITFQNLDLTSAFTLGGVDYTLELLGFQTSMESPLQTSFFSQEGGANTIGLYARFVAPTRVPEPGTLGLLGFGLLAVAGAVRRKTR